jgi:glycosyltransferase involved in cell wall biosynthesis
VATLPLWVVRMPSRSIWIDITELFDQFRVASHPTGISRTVLNLADALVADPGAAFEAARPLFWHPTLRRPLAAEDPQLSPLTAFFPQLSAMYEKTGMARTSYSSRTMKAIATSLPRSVRYRLFPADNGVGLFAHWARRQGVRLRPVHFAAGDCLFVPGSFWLGRYMPSLVAKARSASIPITALVHDVLLLSHPEWLCGRHSEQFRRGCQTLLPECAAIVCNSRHTREELRRHVPLPDDLPVQVCRLADQTFEGSSRDVPAPVLEILDRRYVLFVSTIVPRKNHKLLVEAWRQLWERLGPSTPYLVLVGGGSPDSVLASMMERQESEGGRIIRLGSVDDRSLEALYGHAWMTAYPSLDEGYGLPVAEALSRGKVCLAAPSGGIREISADLIDIIDPIDPRSVVAMVTMYLSNPARLAAREAQIRQCYRSTSWPETARAIRSVLEGTVA